MLCFECKENKSTTILGLCKSCYGVKEAFYHDDLIKRRDKMKSQVFSNLIEQCEMLAELDLSTYSVDCMQKLHKTHANKIKVNVELLKELDLIKENANL